MTEKAGALLRYWPILTTAAILIGTAAVDSFRIGALAQDVGENADLIEINEDSIEAIQRLLIQRQGEIEIDLQRIEIEQRAQSDDLDEIIRLLGQLDQR